jgi:PAS domain S-box-containing protein
MSVDGTIVDLNPAATRLFGYEPHELKGSSLRRIFTAEDLARGLDAQELQAARLFGRSEDDRWHVTKSGTRIWANGVIMAVKDGHARVTGLIKILRDRTDVKTQTEAVENRLKDALRSASRKEGLLSTVSHELRNPLNTLQGSYEILRQRASGTEVSKVLDVVERQLGVMSRMLGDLLDASRMDVGSMKLDIERVELQSAIRSAVSLHENLALRRGLTIQISVPEVPIELEADPTRLEQILRNLLDNAIKYTRRDGHIWVTGTVEGDAAVVRVQDDGEGISAEALPRIFDMFTRAGRALDSATDGLGIGLAVVKNLVHLHHGVVQVQSVGAGKGSEFTIQLPLQQPRLD